VRVGFPAGDSADGLARPFADPLPPRQGKAVVVVSRDESGDANAMGVGAKDEHGFTVVFGSPAR